MSRNRQVQELIKHQFATVVEITVPVEVDPSADVRLADIGGDRHVDGDRMRRAGNQLALIPPTPSASFTPVASSLSAAVLGRPSNCIDQRQVQTATARRLRRESSHDARRQNRSSFILLWCIAKVQAADQKTVIFHFTVDGQSGRRQIRLRADRKRPTVGPAIASRGMSISKV